MFKLLCGINQKYLLQNFKTVKLNVYQQYKKIIIYHKAIQLLCQTPLIRKKQLKPKINLKLSKKLDSLSVVANVSPTVK